MMMRNKVAAIIEQDGEWLIGEREDMEVYRLASKRVRPETQ
jgi:hypothetical protein